MTKCKIETKVSKSPMWNYEHHCKVHYYNWFSFNPKPKDCLAYREHVKDGTEV